MATGATKSSRVIKTTRRRRRGRGKNTGTRRMTRIKKIGARGRRQVKSRRGDIGGLQLWYRG